MTHLLMLLLILVGEYSLGFTEKVERGFLRAVCRAAPTTCWCGGWPLRLSLGHGTALVLNGEHHRVASCTSLCWKQGSFSQRVQHYLFLSPGEKCKIWNAGQENFWLTVKVIHLHSHSSRHSLSTRKCCNIWVQNIIIVSINEEILTVNNLFIAILSWKISS